jgi:cell division protein FtsQ
MWDSAQRLNRIADVLLALAVILALYGALHLALRLPVFPLREVRLTRSLSLVSADQVAALVQREVRGNFFTVDLAGLRAAFAKLPWVRNVSLRRTWPDRIEVNLEEHVPLARWGDSGLVNRHGEVFNAAYDGELPVFIGPAGSAKEMAIEYEYFRRSLAAIGKAPQQLQVTARRAWQVKLDDGTTLELGREALEARLARFVAAFPAALNPLAGRFERVDLRYANGFAVRMPDLRQHKRGPKDRKSTSQG